MAKKLYAAYGSNINLEQMAFRCPRSTVAGTAMLKGYELQFRHHATIEPNEDSEVPLLLWNLDPSDEKVLDRYEGEPKYYRKENIEVELNGEKVNAMVYIMNGDTPLQAPSAEYYNTIEQGYKENGLDLSYLETAYNDAVLSENEELENMYGITYWVCRNHFENKNNCSTRQIKESCFFDAFIRLYNKLKSQYSSIIAPLLTRLQDLNNKRHTGNQQYMEIQKETAKLKEQLHVLARLKTKGFIDDEKYITQSTELSARIEKLNAELRKLSQADDEDEVIDQISEITAIIENGTDLMTQFDEVMFEGCVCQAKSA